MSIEHFGRTRGGWGRRVALSLTTILASGLAVPALAQTPPAYRNLDGNGIDLTHGDRVWTFVEGTIGSGKAQLPLVRRTTSPKEPSTWDAVTFDRSVTPTIGGYASTIIISTGWGESERFTTPNIYTTPYTAEKKNGATVGGAGGYYVYTSASGRTITFSDPSNHEGGGESNLCFEIDAPLSTVNCKLLPTSFAEPDGSEVTLSYSLHRMLVGGSEFGDQDFEYYWRLESVANSYGYSIGFSYQNDSPTWNAPPPNDWYYRSGAAFGNGGTQASVSYSYPALGTVDITDFASNTWRLTGLTMARPGEFSTPYYSATAGSGTWSVTNNGVTTSYSRSLNTMTNVATMTVTDPLSNTTTIVSDMSIGRPTSVTNALGKTTSFTYDGDDRLTRVTAPEGNYVEVTLDARGNPTQTKMRDKANNSANDITTTASYDSTCSNPVTCNQPNSVTDARSNTTNYSYYSTHGGIQAVTAPAPGGSGTRPETRYAYTLANGEYQLTSTSTCQTTASCASGADEVKSSVTYNSQGQVTSGSIGAGDASLTATTAATYTAMGDVATVDGPLSGTDDTVTYRYDAARRVVGIISPIPGPGKPFRAEKRTYDTAGRVTMVEMGTVTSTSDIGWAAFASSQRTSYTYDANGRVTKQTVTASSTTYQVTHYSYDALGRLECTALRMNPANWNTGSACTANTAGSAGPDRITKNTYDAAGRVTKVQTGYGATEQADEVTTAYSDNGKVASVTDAEGNKTTYEYDGHDRVAKTRMPSTTKGAGTSSTTDYVQLIYDANSNVTSVRLRGYDADSTQHIDYTYDTLNRPTAKNLPGSEPDVAYAYDLLGRLTGASHTGNDLTFTYDALGRNLTARSNALDSINFNGTVSYEYDLAGRRTKLIWPNGEYVNYEYLVTGETTVIRENGATSGIGVLATYAYDNLGRRTSLTYGNGVVTTYGVDNVSRLSSLTHNLSGSGDDVATHFTYNPASQISDQTRTNDSYAWGGHYNLGRNYTSNGLNQLTVAGGETLSYDSRGNLASVVIGAKSDSFSYSSENLLTGATFVDPSLGTSSVALSYDPMGRLFKVLVGTTGQRFLYDGAEQIAQLNASGIMQRRYVRGPGADEVLVEYTGSGTATRTFLQTDERGSVVARTDATGAKIVINSYDEYGIPASGNAGRFQYTGQAWIPELGMYYYKARVYSPTLGRFLQTDPIGYGDGMNLYSYVRNNPTNFRDPTGLHCTDQQTDWGEDCEPVVAPGPIKLRPNEGGLVRGGVERGGIEGVSGSSPLLPESALLPKPEVYVRIDCNDAKKESGPAQIVMTTGSFVAVAGASGTLGQFINPETGTRGYFWSLGGGFGVDLGASVMTGQVKSIGSFAGNGRSLSGGAGGGFMIIMDSNRNYLGTLYGISGRGASYSLGTVKLFWCEARK